MKFLDILVYKLGFPFYREPHVGMLLCDKIWGADETLIEIIKVSPNKKFVKYKFLRMNGSPVIDNIFEGEFAYLVINKYNVFRHLSSSG